jgi:HK97 family phage prohead protease
MEETNVERQHLDLSFKIKAADGEPGTFEGMLAMYGGQDLGGDSIVRGAFTKTLQASNGAVPLLWQHNPAQPVGQLQCKDSTAGIQVKGKLLMTLPMARDAYELIKAGVIKGLSIGYDALQESYENGVRLLKEVRLWEGSLVTFPMNESAMITSVKGMSDTEKAGHLQNLNRHLKQVDYSQAQIRMSLKSLFGDDIDDELPADDPARLEDPFYDGEMSMLVSELKAFAEELTRA